MVNTDFAVGLLTKYAEPLLKKCAQHVKDSWEIFKVDFNIAFASYSKNSYEKYSKIKTILYRTEPKYLCDFFEVPLLSKPNTPAFLAEHIVQVLDLSHFVLIQGSGGIGKSTLMKHFYLDSLKSEELIPVFFELKEVNDLEGEYEFEDLFFEKLFGLGSTIKRECMEYALQSGTFVFLLDGYDEIHTEKQERFIKMFSSFCDRYPENYYILSSRPCSEFIEFQRFTVLSTLPLSIEQALSLIKKLKFDDEIKERFLTALKSKLFDTHYSFASNPLLLNIMLLTFDNYAEIPEKLHLFYSNAFETLYSKHDATKAGYRREMRCKLSYDDFRNIFACFCFITYSQGKYEFTHDELMGYLLKAKQATRIDIDSNNYIFDLVNSLCVLYKDGVYYQFAHRSFQEYFTAVFLKELSDSQMKKLAMQIIERDTPRSINDSVFSMLFDMAQFRFEKNILILLFDKVSARKRSSLYDHYVKTLVSSLSFVRGIKKEEEERFFLGISFRNFGIEKFLYDFSYFYNDFLTKMTEELTRADNMFMEFLKNKKEYETHQIINIKDVLQDKEVYCLFKSTWIGERIKLLCELKEHILKKQEQTEVDLSCLLEE